MQLPPFTPKSAALYLAGVLAFLLTVYLLVAILLHATPRQAVPAPNAQKTSSMLNSSMPCAFEDSDVEPQSRTAACLPWKNCREMTRCWGQILV
jgi:hypothetical protein